MKHLGDITKINGADVPTVNAIIGGSPCQDLSVAGKRQGLQGKRSGLFMEQIRIIKEMRAKDAESGRTGADIRPRFMVWENVPGAFSVNGGRDFAAVLEETIRVAEPEAPDILPPAKGWTAAGCFLGDGWSVAWRVLDAQFWGVPQRRRRIALVADFGGGCAPEILFERESVPRHSQPGGTAGKGASGNAEGGVITASGFPLGFRAENTKIYHETATTICNGTRPGFTCGVCWDGGDTSGTLTSRNAGGAQRMPDKNNFNAVVQYYKSKGQSCCYSEMGDVAETVCAKYGTGGGNVPIVSEQHAFGISSFESNAMRSSNPHSGCYEAMTARTLDNTGGNPACNQGGIAICFYNGFGDYKLSELGKSLLANDDVTTSDLVCSVDARNGTENATVNGSLQTRGGSSMNANNLVRNSYIVRRLTPTECERLQGFPDGWTDIGEWTDTKGRKRQTSDAARYKALGNSIAIPPWLFVLSRLNRFCEDKTMASLFDGIGGFPLIWSFLNGLKSCVWASEIEEFPIAVTKRRYGGE